MKKICAVTGGLGFIGSRLVDTLSRDGWSVRVIDTLIRGNSRRVTQSGANVSFFNVDVRDENSLTDALDQVSVVFHLAALNGTRNFYTHADLVLDIGIRGILAVVNSCKKANVRNLVVASSAEVYQEAAVIPTPEDIQLMVPSVDNPRYSYAVSKIVSEVVALNYHRDFFERLLIFRPHNVYGPDMGYKHVIPELIMKIREFGGNSKSRTSLILQGDGSETRAFCYVDDCVKGILRMLEYGEHRGVYHIGTEDEVSIKVLAEKIINLMGVKCEIIAGAAPIGGTKRRCPSIKKISSLGYVPEVSLDKGLSITTEWYQKNDFPRGELN